MDAVYISIEKNAAVFEEYKKLWSGRGITGIRADTMTEGIEAAIAISKSETQYLYFADIAADEIDFMPLLMTLDDVVDAPILIAVSKDRYSEDEHHRALDSGAFFYGPYCDDPEKNINAVNVSVKNYHRVAKRQKTSPDIITCGAVLISLSRRKAYVNDSPVSLTLQEFEALHILMLHPGKALTHSEIFSHIHDSEYDEKTAKYVIYNSMNRLCQKMRKVAKQDYIKSVYDVGYTFSLT